jgi:hypothetical protein
MQTRPPPRHHRLPSWVQDVVDAHVTRALARAVILTLYVAVVVVAAAGPSGMTGNAAPRLALVVVWGAVVAASVLLGPVWKAVSPFRTVTRWIGRLTDPEETAVRPLPDRLGVWPAAAGLAAWAWVAEATPTPGAVLLILVVYGAVQVVAGVWYGQAWFAHGETLEVLSSTFGRIAPIGRDPEGRLALRNPLADLARFDAAPGLRSLIAVLLAWELVHAVSETTQWPLVLAELGLRRGVATSTLALAAGLTVAVLAVRLATPRPFLVAATVPMAAGWTLAHHVGPLVVDWRVAMADLADPLGRGWVLHGFGGPPMDPSAPGAVALAQLLLLVVGACGSVLAAHRMAVARYDLRAARAVQFPLRVVLIALVLVGVVLQSAVAD